MSTRYIAGEYPEQNCPRCRDLEDRIEELEELEDRVANGFQGGCWCCEIVGEKNIELQRKYAALTGKIRHWITVFNEDGSVRAYDILCEIEALLEDDDE